MKDLFIKSNKNIIGYYYQYDGSKSGNKQSLVFCGVNAYIPKYISIVNVPCASIGDSIDMCIEYVSDTRYCLSFQRNGHKMESIDKIHLDATGYNFYVMFSMLENKENDFVFRLIPQ